MRWRRQIIWPEDAIKRMRDMRSLGATWRVIGIGFGCEGQTARNFYIAASSTQKPHRKKLMKLLRIAERELRA